MTYEAPNSKQIIERCNVCRICKSKTEMYVEIDEYMPGVRIGCVCKLFYDKDDNRTGWDIEENSIRDWNLLQYDPRKDMKEISIVIASDYPNSGLKDMCDRLEKFINHISKVRDEYDAA